ncbi:bacillithiol system redox-active protein YtxJ [Rubeoparvulum massiliense]|uniref:bacillithiol system redox-active protein YtxJ n=1 Tax=Rubeoparvulum massiliense TaxID=1631346 RepID=UPI00065DE3F5|nr:bacillithiol system redox-active protein YtxJ [Rubeoparvulum massiliense]
MDKQSINRMEKEVKRMIQPVLSMTDWENLLERSHQYPIFFLKHSTQCPISAKAHAQFLQSREEMTDQSIGFFMVKVIEDRPVSLAIADATGIQHASPQVMLIKNGMVKWHASHFEITVANMLEAYEKEL